MLAFLEKLRSRKFEIARKVGSEWQTLVIDIADEKEIDTDETLAALSRLGKSPDDLAAAVGLLAQRRQWAQQVTGGNRAESDHPVIKRKIEAEVARFTEIERQHEEKLQPLSYELAEAGRMILDGASASRELSQTSTDPLALAAVADAAEKLAELRREQAHIASELRSKEDRLATITAQKDDDLDGQAARLSRDIGALREQLASFATRTEELVSESDAARLQLLRPEAI